jgi:hypothetical protein
VLARAAPGANRPRCVPVGAWGADGGSCQGAAADGVQLGDAYVVDESAQVPPL